MTIVGALAGAAVGYFTGMAVSVIEGTATGEQVWAGVIVIGAVIGAMIGFGT